VLLWLGCKRLGCVYRSDSQPVDVEEEKQNYYISYTV